MNEALRKLRWIPSLPHSQLLAEKGRHDVLVLPSLFEGFGLVILEAMSRGLPVITTSNTAGPDIIERRRSGFIIPIRSPEAITVELDRLATDSGKLREMKRAAFEAAKSFAWQSYRNNLIRTLRAIRASSGAVLAGIDWKVLVLKKLQQVWTQLREQSLIPAEFAD